jgi:hypothetical protein
MKKVISLFKRNYDGDRLVYDEIVPGAEWVVQGEGVPTVKMDGTCCLVRDGKLYRRFDLKPGKRPPSGFEAAQEPDPETGKCPGWVPVGEGPEDRWHREAFERCPLLDDGTYELVGPKIQGNPYGLDRHGLIRHGSILFRDEQPPMAFSAMKGWFETNRHEGVVWHHPDGRMVKIKRRDFGLRWPASTVTL